MAIDFKTDEEFKEGRKQQIKSLHPSGADTKPGKLFAPAKEFVREGIKGAYRLSTFLSPVKRLTEEEQNKYLSQVGLGETPPEEQNVVTKGSARLGGIVGSGGFMNPAAALTSAGGGQVAEELGAPPWLQTVVELALGLRSSGGGSPIQQTGRIAQPRASATQQAPAARGRITTSRLTHQMNRVNEEAAQLAQNIGTGNRRFQLINQAIDRQHPIQQRFNQFFTNLENYTRASNRPIQNTQPLTDFLSNEARLYQGTGAQTDLGNFVMNEVNGWNQHGVNDWYNMFRRYRLNNQRIREIRGNQNIAPGLRRQQSSFLERMNDSLRDTFRQNFSANDPWMRAFEESNSAYHAYQNTLGARQILQPLIQRNMTDAQLQRFLGNPERWEQLERFLGPHDANAMRQILQDIQTARNGLRSIQRFPGGLRGAINLLKLPALKSAGLGKLGALLSTRDAFQWAVGRYYSSPQFQGTFHEFAEALARGNTNAAAIALNKIGEEREEKNKGIKFTPDE